MAQTHLEYGHPGAVQRMSVGLFSHCMQRTTALGRMVGPMPQQGDMTEEKRFQTTHNMPIVRCRDLEKQAGDEVTFDLVQPVRGKPIMGGRMAEGRGERLSFVNDRLRINQTRKPISPGDTMTQQRTPYDLRKIAYPEAKTYMIRLEDQLILTHLAGARGFHTGPEWVVPLMDDPDFKDICVNEVKAPSRNRHFVASGGGLEQVSATGNEIKIATTDQMTIDTIDAIGALLDNMQLPPSNVIFEGDTLAHDDPIRVLLVSPNQYLSIKQNSNFRVLQSNAVSRSSACKGDINSLFKGEVGIWNGVFVKKLLKPIRFYPGDTMRYCAGKDGVETTTDKIPNGGWDGYAVDRALLLGGQALMEAYGNRRFKGQSKGLPYFWSEKLLDHDDKVEIAVGMIGGKSKVRFDFDYGSGLEATDYGVIAIDTAVRLIGNN